jgi:hypothetical protein
VNTGKLINTLVAMITGSAHVGKSVAILECVIRTLPYLSCFFDEEKMNSRPRQLFFDRNSMTLIIRKVCVDCAHTNYDDTFLSNDEFIVFHEASDERYYVNMDGSEGKVTSLQTQLPKYKEKSDEKPWKIKNRRTDELNNSTVNFRDTVNADIDNLDDIVVSGCSSRTVFVIALSTGVHNAFIDKIRFQETYSPPLRFVVSPWTEPEGTLLLANGDHDHHLLNWACDQCKNIIRKVFGHCLHQITGLATGLLKQDCPKKCGGICDAEQMEKSTRLHARNQCVSLLVKGCGMSKDKILNFSKLRHDMASLPNTDLLEFDDKYDIPDMISFYELTKDSSRVDELKIKFITEELRFAFVVAGATIEEDKLARSFNTALFFANYRANSSDGSGPFYGFAFEDFIADRASTCVFDIVENGIADFPTYHYPIQKSEDDYLDDMVVGVEDKMFHLSLSMPTNVTLKLGSTTKVGFGKRDGKYPSKLFQAEDVPFNQIFGNQYIAFKQCTIAADGIFNATNLTSSTDEASIVITNATISCERTVEKHMRCKIVKFIHKIIMSEITPIRHFYFCWMVPKGLELLNGENLPGGCSVITVTFEPKATRKNYNLNEG